MCIARPTSTRASMRSAMSCGSSSSPRTHACIGKQHTRGRCARHQHRSKRGLGRRAADQRCQVRALLAAAAGRRYAISAPGAVRALCEQHRRSWRAAKLCMSESGEGSVRAAQAASEAAAEPSGWRWFPLTGVVIVLDQVAKAWIVQHLDLYQRIQVLPVLDITLLYNTGAAFSFLSEASGWQRWMFIVL